jgi:serine/threonine-protein kinase HipA
MLCAIDGHAKNFSLFLEAGGQYRLTPRYDVLSAFPVLGRKSGHLSRQKVKMAMGVRGDGRRHYRWDSILLRHWQSQAKRCGISAKFDSILTALLEDTPRVIGQVESILPKGFPASVQEPIFNGLTAAARRLAA